MSFGTRGTLPTGPTKLVLAVCTRHVIAALILLDLSPAARAERHIVSVLARPAFELRVQVLLAGNAFTVPLIPAFEANFSSTGQTFQLDFVVVLTSHVRLAAGLGAPSNQWICLKSRLILEPLILHEKLSLIHQNFIDFLLGNRLLALVVQARNLVELVVDN